jgi:hypothetical protein
MKPRSRRPRKPIAVRFKRVDRGRGWGSDVPKTGLEEGLSKWRVEDQSQAQAEAGPSGGAKTPDHQQNDMEPDEIDPMHDVALQVIAIGKFPGDTILDPFHTYPSQVVIKTVGQTLRHGKCVGKTYTWRHC